MERKDGLITQTMFDDMMNELLLLESDETPSAEAQKRIKEIKEMLEM